MKLIWLDLETTGLDPKYDSILEIAVFESDLDTPFKATKIYEQVLNLHPSLHAKMSPHVREMHEKNGLLSETVTSTATIMKVQRELLTIIPENGYRTGNIGEYSAPVLAGSTIHFDRSFLHEWMPMVEARFHHRHYDVSAIKLFCQSLGMAKFPKGEAHRAAADVLESIDHAKRCAEWLVNHSYTVDAKL